MDFDLYFSGCAHGFSDNDYVVMRCCYPRFQGRLGCDCHDLGLLGCHESIRCKQVVQLTMLCQWIKGQELQMHNAD